MSSRPTDRVGSRSRIAHGSIMVLAYLHKADANCAKIASETILSRSAAYRWLTELEEAGILTAQPMQRDDGRPVLVYHLDDEDLGAAARVIVDRLVPTDADD